MAKLRKSLIYDYGKPFTEVIVKESFLVAALACCFEEELVVPPHN